MLVLVLLQKGDIINETRGNLVGLWKGIDIEGVRCTVVGAVLSGCKGLETVDASKDGFESPRHHNRGHNSAWICSRKNDLFV